jgi:NAD(P)-dependent dehydrogenase (short-subunit alcohol dehydrogenase family)
MAIDMSRRCDDRNIASLSGQGGNGRAAYGSSKAALELLTKVMAVELSEYGINVNNIAPGAIETEMVATAHDAATRAAYNYLIPRFGMVRPKRSPMPPSSYVPTKPATSRGTR